MNSQAHDTGRTLNFDSHQQLPLFRHPYEKYISRISNDSIYRINESNRDIFIGRNSSRVGKRKDLHTGFQDKNIYICQTFLKENPFFNAYYPDARPRSENGGETSGRGSERSRSVGTDFDDSRTYRVIHSEGSNGNEDQSSVTRCKFKKSDDIHHFHEHHHFFHEKDGKHDKSREANGNPLIDPNKSFLKQPIQESCMFYQKEERGEARKCREGSRGMSRSSSKTGRKSSDNETYTVVCEYCQKLLRDYPNARIVGHENVPVRLSSQVGDRKAHVQYGYNGEAMQKMSWIPANTFVAEPVQGPSKSHDSMRLRKTDRLSKISDESDRSLARAESREKKAYRSKKRRVNNKKSSNNKLILFRCDHCKSIIQFPYVFSVLKSSSSSSCCCCSSEEILKKINMNRSVANGKTATKAAAAVLKKSNTNAHKKSPILEESSSSDAMKSFSAKASFVDKVKSSSQKASRMSTTSAVKGGSTEKASRAPGPSFISSRETIQDGKKRSSSYNETTLTDKRADKEKKAFSEMNKRVLTTKGSIKVSASKENPVFAETKSLTSAKKRSPSANKKSEVTKKKSSCCIESKNLANRDEDSEAVKKVRKSTDKKVSTSLREIGVSSKRAVGTEVYMAKVEGKPKAVLMKERSMQTTSGTIADEMKSSKRNSRVSKAVGAMTDTKRFGTAPGNLVNTKSTSTHKESSGVRGNSTLSKRSLASKEVTTIDPVTDATIGLSGIQSEISDLKNQLYRLEAMHNLNCDPPETEIAGNHEGVDCPKHPIVVCTSTTYIMANYGVEHDDKYPKETLKPGNVPSKKKDSSAEFGLHVENTPPRPRRVYIGQMRMVNENPEEKDTSKGKYCDSGNCLGKSATFNPPIIGDRLTKAANRVCQCSNRDFLSRYCGASKSCERGDGYRRLFGNGKNQKTMWAGNGASTDVCCMKFVGNAKSHCRWSSVGFDREEVLKALASIRGIDGLSALRSCSAVLGERELPVTRGKNGSDVSKATAKNGITIEDVRIEGKHGKGYFLRTSVSDISEYRNGSLIRLTGKSGWVVLTKKLFLQKIGEAGRDNFVVCPAMTARQADSRSAITIKAAEDNRAEREDSEDIFADYDLRRDSPRQVLSDSSIYFPLREDKVGKTAVSTDKDVSGASVHLPKNVRQRNRGVRDFREIVNKRKSDFSDELCIMRGARRTSTCGFGDAQCTCKQEETRRKSKRSGKKISKRKKEAVPVLFEEMKAVEEDGVREVSSDVSLKYVFAEAHPNRRTRKVFWSSDWRDTLNKNKYVFAVSRSGKNNKEKFSMNEKHKKLKWRRRVRNRKNRGSDDQEGTPPVESEVFPSNRCACCNCRPDHICSGPKERQEGISGLRRLMKDFGLNLNFLKRFHNDRVFQRGSEELPTDISRREERQRRFDGCEEDVRSGYNTTRNYGPRCDCAKQIEALLKKVDLCRPPPPVPSAPANRAATIARPTSIKPQHPPPPRPSPSPSSISITRLSPRISSSPSPPPPPPVPKTVSKPSNNAVWEEKEQSEEEVQIYQNERARESASSLVTVMPLVSASDSKKTSKESSEMNIAKSSRAEEPDVEDFLKPEENEDPRQRIAEIETILKTFETRLDEVKRKSEAYACKCEGANKEVVIEEFSTEVSGEITGGVNEKVREEAIPHPAKVEVAADKIIKDEEIITETTEKHSAMSAAEHPCCSLPSKIEIVLERKVCTCQQCSNIHYIDRQYLPTSWIKKCNRGKNTKQGEKVASKKEEELESDEENLVFQSDLEGSERFYSDDTDTKPKMQAECDKKSGIACECPAKEKGKPCCDCDSKLKLIECRLKALEKDKKAPDEEGQNYMGRDEERTIKKASEMEKRDTSGGDTDVSSWENIESETDGEVKTKIVTCDNMDLFFGGNENIRKKCQCTEDSPCPFKFIPEEGIHQTKNIYFITNIELLRHWSGLYVPDYKYCKSFWNVKKSTPVKVHRDWKDVRSAISSFFRRKNYKIFNWRKKNEQSLVGTISSSLSADSFLNDCSRSSRPLKKRSFRILSEGPHPTRPEHVKGKGRKRKKRTTKAHS